MGVGGPRAEPLVGYGWFGSFRAGGKISRLNAAKYGHSQHVSRLSPGLYTIVSGTVVQVIALSGSGCKSIAGVGNRRQLEAEIGRILHDIRKDRGLFPRRLGFRERISPDLYRPIGAWSES